MRVSLKWLREYVDVASSPEEVARRLTLAGTEVGEIERLGGPRGGGRIGGGGQGGPRTGPGARRWPSAGGGPASSTHRQARPRSCRPEPFGACPPPAWFYLKKSWASPMSTRASWSSPRTPPWAPLWPTTWP